MKIVIAHHTTQDKAIATVDRSSNDLFDMGSGSVVLADQKKTWTGPRMDFSLVAKLGFIALPVTGSVLVDDVNVNIECELPAMARNFIGEEKIRSAVEKRVSRLLTA